MAYTAKDKAIEDLLDDYESGVLASDFQFPGSTVDYLHAVIAVKAEQSRERAAQSQQRWTRVAAFAACSSVVVALAAVVVAALR